ncbi:NAD(P)-dependent dehydrogenase (short-subunit alcohol dehydrogenase family) [Catenuloplanes nepalensis]|uniref:NAD(P)-dependent dehydrogenase (Short-subunit alcohol dehydrogenase family) n=1 Tax=Catenuloplanes nepalensis TaxID=587533 RepID=A0ABT9MP20_9ACTN|nr:SDR family NAD(P)-dependent oxidoreductase [Catenuloplanes nepalensis]MDP9792801.1 NAD(P)-dependent dehydrogenase (short-subunit alcohol dehydrogenase family) [Catenuloplanes nepalensis]
MSRITTPYGFHTTADEVAAGHDLAGRRAIVTGGASGIGLETVRTLVRAGADVTVAVRDPDAAQAALKDDTVRIARLDVADPDSVRAFTAAWDGPLHLLINNAGVMAVPDLRRTAGGIELQFATNHLGHFALATGLHGALAAAGGARIVALSSAGHHVAPVDFDDIDFENRPYDPWVAYGQAKTATVLFTVEATRRWAADGIHANAVSPGGVMTNLQRYIPEETRAQWEKAPILKTPQQGAATTMVAALAPEFDRVGGRYLEDCAEAEVIDDDAEAGLADPGVRRWALDPAAARRLWEVSTAFAAR